MGVEVHKLNQTTDPAIDRSAVACDDGISPARIFGEIRPTSRGTAYLAAVVINDGVLSLGSIVETDKATFSAVYRAAVVVNN